MKQYFPDKYSKGRQCDREYMFNIANTMHPRVVEELIDHALSQRFTIKDEDKQKESVIINDEWAN